jgi:hypothetical protein
MQCNYVRYWEGKRPVMCPSVAHEGVAKAHLLHLTHFDNPKDATEFIMFCCHHRRVVEAKLTCGKEVSEFGEIIQPERAPVADVA